LFGINIALDLSLRKFFVEMNKSQQITIHCEECYKDINVTIIYLMNLGRSGWNALLCPSCFAFMMMNELLTEKEK
jgi:hypothetical protein